MHGHGRRAHLRRAHADPAPCCLYPKAHLRCLCGRYTDTAVAGEAAAYAIGLVMVGSASQKAIDEHGRPRASTGRSGPWIWAQEVSTF